MQTWVRMLRSHELPQPCIYITDCYCVPFGALMSELEQDVYPKFIIRNPSNIFKILKSLVFSFMDTLSLPLPPPGYATVKVCLPVQLATWSQHIPWALIATNPTTVSAVDGGDSIHAMTQSHCKYHS